MRLGMPRTYTEKLHPRGHGGKWVKKGLGALSGGDDDKGPPRAPKGAKKSPTRSPKATTPAASGPDGKPTPQAPARKKGPTRSPGQAKAFLDDHYGSWKKDLTPAQEKGMRFYQSPGFALMNGQLRGLDAGGLKKSERASDTDLTRARKASKDLTAAIKTAPPLKQDTTVYRGFSADQFGDLKPGATIVDKGFVSTSLTDDAGAVGKASRKATAEITLPAGTKAAAGSARELVLPPGAKFRVTSVTTRGGSPHVVMEYVPPAGGKRAVTASLTAQVDALLDELDDPLTTGEIDFIDSLGAPSAEDLVAADGLTAAGKRQNWVQQTGTGHLPRYIKRISKHLRKKGMTESHAIATAVNAAKKMCASGDVNFPGKQSVNAGSRAEACKALAEWEAKKAQAKAS